MGEENPPKSEEKPFSVLERFRQLKKEKEQAPSTETANNAQPVISSTVFQASSSSTPSPSPSNEWNRGSRNNKGLNASSESTESAPQDRSRKRILADMHKGQTETEVGITEFIREGVGFDVVLKHRFTDFIVNEIDLEGKVTKLTTIDIPKDNIESETLPTEEDSSILSVEQWDSLREIIDKELDTFVEVDVTDMDKDKRQGVHKAVKMRFGVHVYSNTLDENGKKIMKIGHAKNATRENSRFCSWPKDRPKHLHFVLYKENSETSETVNVLTKMTGVKPNRFGYAGTKDKRAVTTQQMCVSKVNAERFSRCRVLRGIAIGNFSYKCKSLRLGDLKGNRFKIVLRNINISDEVLEKAIENLKTTGFINYFGMQRFGQSTLVPSYEIGRAILTGSWGKAVELILKPREGEACYPDVMEARKIWWKTKDPSAALKPLTRKDRSIEGKLLQGLKKHGPQAFGQAFDSLPQKSVSMYLHSYQSLIWNRVISRRFRSFGLKVLPGDLVSVNPAEPDQDDNREDNDAEDEDEGGVADQADRPRKQRVRVLTAEEARTTGVYDVVYPLPGYDITLPDNEVGAWYKEEVEKEGETMEVLSKLNHRYGLFATYRKMLGRVEELRWSTMQYSNPDEDLQQTDLQALRGWDPPNPSPDGPYKALLIEFNLKPCTYATMAIRELAKCETSTHSQAMISNQMRERDMVMKKRKLDNDCEEQNKRMVEEKAAPDNDCDMEGAKEDEQVKEKRMFNKMEAEADNLINKYLEHTYH